MSLFDSLASDKTPLVLDIGAKYTKIGCAGEFSPRFIIPTEIRCPQTGERRSVYSYKDEKDLKFLLVEFIYTVYFKYYLVSPKDKQVVIVESLLCPLQFKQVLANVLFSHYEVGSVVFVPSHLVSLCALGIRTALVVDVGYTEVQVIPVYELVPVLSAWQAQPIASQLVEKRLRQNLKDTVKTILKNSEKEDSSYLPDIDEISDSDIEDIKVRGCFVTTVERGKLLGLGESLPAPHPPTMEYRLKGDRLLNVPGLVRESAYECLFERDNDALSLPNLILDSILKCSMDTRVQLASNLLLIGGSAMAPGFKPRLMQELRELLSSAEYRDRLAITKLAIHSPPAKENCVAWLGGSLFAATEMYSMKALPREKYLSMQVVPDWSNLAHNELYLSKLSL